MSKNTPAQEFRLGHVKATVWANPVRGSVRHNVTFAKLYKEGDTWKTCASFGRDDLPLVSRVADQAHAWIYAQGRGARPEAPDAETAEDFEQGAEAP